MAYPARALSWMAPGVFGLALTVLQCAPALTTKPVVEPLPGRPAVTIERGDTITYRCAFTDKSERERFIYSFERFIREHSFQVERYDSGGCFVTMKILPPGRADEAQPPQFPLFPTVPPSDTPASAPFQEDTIPTAAADTALPRAGGALKIYLPRAGIDYPFNALVETAPLPGSEGGGPGCMTIELVAPAAIAVTLAPKVVNGAGKVTTVFDIIDQWTRFVKDHPAEGLALFRHCEGIMEFINGQEAVVRGFQAADGRTIRIKLSHADPSAIDRLTTGRALPSPFKMGRYYIKATKDNEDALAANKFSPGERPFLDECILKRGGDVNPIVSFSLNRYDAVLLSGSGDIEYVRRNVLKNGAECFFAGRDRYFISCALRDSLTRAFIRGLVAGPDLLKNVVKAEGAPIARLESDSAPPPPPPFIVREKPAHPEPVTILFRKDDPISKTVAAKLLADITHAGMQGTLLAAEGKSYESALVGRTYGCAVGWTGETVLNDKSEKLRLATIFFNDETNEESRLHGNWEIPLFSVDWYLLAKAGVGLHQGKVSGIYVKPAQ